MKLITILVTRKEISKMKKHNTFCTTASLIMINKTTLYLFSSIISVRLCSIIFSNTWNGIRRCKRENKRLTNTFVARVCARWRMFREYKIKIKGSSSVRGLELNDYIRSYALCFPFPHIFLLRYSSSLSTICFICPMSCVIGKKENKKEQNDQSMGNYRVRVRWSSSDDKRDNSIVRERWWIEFDFISFFPFLRVS